MPPNVRARTVKVKQGRDWVQIDSRLDEARNVEHHTISYRKGKRTQRYSVDVDLTTGKRILPAGMPSEPEGSLEAGLDEAVVKFIDAAYQRHEAGKPSQQTQHRRDDADK